MNAPWSRTTIGEQVTLQRGFDITKAGQRNGTVPVVSSGGVSSFHDAHAVEGPGVVLGRKGVVGSVHYVKEDYWPHDTTLWVKDFHGNDRRFVFYFFKHLAPRLSSLDVGSANPTLNRNHVHPIPTLWPPLSEQRAIAHILGTLDDKIELNRRTNQTLEAIARALFTSWFVAFDPVRAKAAGRNPAGMDAATAALFPSSFRSLACGDVPNGWVIGEFQDLAVNSRRTVDPRSVDPATPYIGLEHMPRRSVALDAWGNAERVESGKSKFDRDDVLFGKLRPYFHKVGFAPLNGICSTDILVFTPKLPEMLSLMLMTCSSDQFVAFADGGSHGTRMPRASWDRLSRFPVCLPSSSLLSVFDDVVRPLLDRIRANIFESRSLNELRDTLLPRLLSGEVQGFSATQSEEPDK